ncbi:metallophosphoesterase [Bacteroidota bacterium]
MRHFLLSTLVLVLFVITISPAQKVKIPRVHSNIISDFDGNLLLQYDGKQIFARRDTAQITLEKLIGDPQATKNGIYFDFKDALGSGTLYYGFIPYGDSKHPQPVFFRQPVQILNGKAFVNLTTMGGRYDMIGWQKKGYGTLGYRVVNNMGDMLYDGKVTFKGIGPFEIDNTIIEGPFINLLNEGGCTISCETNNSVIVEIEVNGKVFQTSKKSTHHEIKVEGLEPDKSYDYIIKCGADSFKYGFKTAPLTGSRKPFSFAYASDSRSGQGGGERDIYGANAYIMKRIASLAKFKNVAFMQFSGDMISGYKTDPNELALEYVNWKHSIEPFAAYYPLITTMGNHEALMHTFAESVVKYYAIDKFPFDKVSGEKIYQDHFVNPMNGPDSEDGASYDPNPKKKDFPSYKESVFYYTYDNVAMIVLNSDYWYAPTTNLVSITSGNIHAYIMDMQLKWLEETTKMLEEDENIDHIFISLHTPFFPNGGHVGDDMWYNGNNNHRPYIAGEPVAKGIIERRDDLLEIIVNKSEKTVAILTGDEHNYCKTHINPGTNIYPDDYNKPKITLKRSIYQINNGAAGAPYYAQEITPWSSDVTGFTTQNALVFFHVEGKKIIMEVFNPDTLEKFDELQLR